MSQNGLIARFWGFDKLIGSALVKITYYTGLIAILVVVAACIVGGIMTQGKLGGPGLAAAAGGILGGALVLIFWRFFCELAILSFQTYNRLGEIRDRLPPLEPLVVDRHAA